MDNEDLLSPVEFLQPIETVDASGMPCSDEVGTGGKPSANGRQPVVDSVVDTTGCYLIFELVNEGTLFTAWSAYLLKGLWLL